MTSSEEMVEMLKEAVQACEGRCGFWKSLAYAACGALIGVASSWLPFAVRDVATRDYVDSSSPWARDKAAIVQRLSLQEAQGAQTSSSVNLLGSTLSELNGNVQALLKLSGPR